MATSKAASCGRPGLGKRPVRLNNFPTIFEMSVGTARKNKPKNEGGTMQSINYFTECPRCWDRAMEHLSDYSHCIGCCYFEDRYYDDETELLALLRVEEGSHGILSNRSTKEKVAKKNPLKKKIGLKKTGGDKCLSANDPKREAS